MNKIIVNKIKCKKCGDTIESTYRHDFKLCKCGAVAVDGGKDYLRRLGYEEDYEELSEVKKMNDKYVFETESSREMEIVASRHKILSVLDDIKNWRRELYKGYDNNVRILCNGKLYTYSEFEKAKDELPKDEHGLIKDCKHVYLDNDLIDKIDDLLSEVNYLLDC